MKTSANTIKATTPLAVQSVIGPLTKRYYNDILQWHLRRLPGTLYTDVLISKCTYFTGKNIDQVYTGGKGFVYVDPRPTKGDAGMAL